MKTLIPIASMSTTDKLLAMEALWEDICHLNQANAPPTWHGDVLKKREQGLEAGIDEFLDWEDAKRTINEQTA